jgi:hypothetical protein
MRIAYTFAERRRVKVAESGVHVRPPGMGVGQSAGLSKMAGTAFENEMRRGREI